MIRAPFLSLCAALVFSVAALAAPPDAAVVKAAAHSASTMAVEVLRLTPPAGLPEEEAGIVSLIGATALGEAMGWGEDHWDGVEPEVAQVVMAQFQEAFRLLESLDGTTLTYPQLLALAAQLRAHFETMRDAVALPAGSPDAPAQALRQAKFLAEILVLHVKELPELPVVSGPRPGAALLLRTVRAGTKALAATLAGHPELLAKIQPRLAELEAFAANPPSCAAQPDQACVESLAVQALVPLKAIHAALK